MTAEKTRESRSLLTSANGLGIWIRHREQTHHIELPSDATVSELYKAVNSTGIALTKREWLSFHGQVLHAQDVTSVADAGIAPESIVDVVMTDSQLVILFKAFRNAEQRQFIFNTSSIDMFEQRTQSQDFKDICDSFLSEMMVHHAYDMVEYNEQEEITTLAIDLWKSDLNYDLDLSEIAKLKALTSLSFEYTLNDEPMDISPLSALTSLECLMVNGNDLKDISALSTLRSLIHLYLCANEISNISSLSTLTSLETLHISENNISDVSPLFGLTALRELEIAGNPISDEDISQLKSHLTNCTILNDS